MDAAKAAVAEHADDIAALGEGSDMTHNGVGVGKVSGILPERLEIVHELGGVEALCGLQLLDARDGRDGHRIRVHEG